MYVTKQMLAAENNCSVRTISRIVSEMEQSGRYPMAIRRVKGVQVNREQFEQYVCSRGRKEQIR